MSYGGIKNGTVDPLESMTKNSCTKNAKSANSNVVRGELSMSTEQRLAKVETTLRQLLRAERQKERNAEEALRYLLTGKRPRAGRVVTA
jgi:hypothetical protein